MKKFYAVIGNPPYQEEFTDDGNKSYASPIYHKFMDSVESVSDRVELITPARFLFDAGSTPKSWNRKKLEDPHFKVMKYEGDASAVFPDTDIKGGVAITYRDEKSTYGAIGSFTPYDELRSVSAKVQSKEFESLTDVIATQTRFNLLALYEDHPEMEGVIGSGGKDKRFRNNIFDKVPYFTETPDKDSYSVLGVIKNQRCWRYISKKYVEQDHSNLLQYKVCVPRVNGKGVLGETLSTPVILGPGEGYTQTFIGIGDCPSRTEAENLLKYIKTKFLRAMLAIKKVTQDNERDTWSMIPLQDFTSASDIDWDKPVSDIDKQLYAKYGLDDKEITFIESHVKEMS